MGRGFESLRAHQANQWLSADCPIGLVPIVPQDAKKRALDWLPHNLAIEYRYVASNNQKIIDGREILTEARSKPPLYEPRVANLAPGPRSRDLQSREAAMSDHGAPSLDYLREQVISLGL